MNDKLLACRLNDQYENKKIDIKGLMFACQCWCKRKIKIENKTLYSFEDKSEIIFNDYRVMYIK